MMNAIINIHAKKGILDPKAKATKNALSSLGFEDIKNIKMGKQIIIDLGNKTSQEAKDIAEQMAKKLLVNEVIEDYTIEIQQD